MQKLSKWKITLSIICTIIALVYAAPNVIDIEQRWLPSNKINLGLDLRGGSHLLLNVDFDSYIKDVMENLGENIRKHLKEEKIGYKNFTFDTNLVKLQLRNPEDINKLEKIITKIDRNLLIKTDDDTTSIIYNASNLADVKSKVIEQSIEIIRMRIDSSGTKEPIIQRQGDKDILLQVPGEEDPAKLKSVLGKTAKLTFHLVDENANLDEATKTRPPIGSILLKGDSEGIGEYYLVVKKKVIVSGDQLTNAQASFDQNSRPVVAFSFNDLGGKIFSEITKNNSGKRIAIVLDNRLLSAPVINEPILGGNGVISGNFSIESANELALLLRAGALPAPLKIIEERSIGPSLGADSIESGKKAGIIGFISVAIFMFLSYGVLGLFANIALGVAILYILALLSILQATLTLPGIAGIILTMGMAVDANVLIYERIKEELGKGATNLYAIRQGFETAFATIVDSNVTTLAAACLLYIFGVGAIRGFAVTLSIGILSSMFAAIIITKLQVDLWMKYCRPKSLGIL
ncbi:MAG: protein translocase subunit SecD [Rickettsiaceae bacterium]|nr:MAG: protein translocase subunit SecD [Rickettsiaceae bacterium]